MQTQPLRVTSRLVQVNVIVQNKNGQPVTGLTKDDFTILDQGQPQTITSMTEQSSKVSTTLPAAPAPNTFSNRYQERYGVPPSVSVILLDALNTSLPNMSSARAQVVKFLRQLQPQDRVALYGLSDKIYILHDFSTDTAGLLRAMTDLPRLQQTQGNATAPMDFAVPTGDAVVDAWATSVVQAGADFNTINRVEQTALALEAIANHLASLPGRKNLIWISGSFPFQIGMDSIGGIGGSGPQSFSKEVEKAARAMSNANVAIYAVDAGGLTAPRGGRGGATPNVDSMVVLADRTGGRAFFNTNDISGAIRRAIDDSRVTYVLSYYPSHNQWDGRFREIKVKVNGPGVEIRARKGYFAFANATVSSKDKEEIMVDAVKGSLESTALGMDVQVDPVDIPGAREIKAKVTIDPKQLQLAKMEDRWTDTIDVKWVQLAADGHVVSSTSQSLSLSIPQADYERVLQKDLTFSGDVSLANDTSDVRLVARDSGNGSVVTVNISVAKLFAPTAAQ